MNMNNEEKLKDIFKKAETNVYEQLLNLHLTPIEFEKQCIKYSKHSLLCFISAVAGKSFEIRDFHKKISAVLEYLAFAPVEESKRLILSIAPRSGKSTITQLYTAWLIGLNEKSNHIFTSYGQRLSNNFSVKIHLVLQNPIYKLCFSEYKGFSQGGKTALALGGSLFATSVTGAITGFSAGSSQLPTEIASERRKQKNEDQLFGTPGLLVVDDPLKSGASEAELAALNGFWLDEANPRRTGNWCQLIIATRFSANDLHGKLLHWDRLYDSVSNPSGWLYLNIKALRGPKEEWDPVDRVSEDDELWGSHPTLNKVELLKLKRLSPAKFNILYQGETVTAEIGALKASDLQEPEPWPENIFYRLLAIDTSFGLNEKADNTAFCLIGLSTTGKLWILKSITIRGDFVQIRSQLAEFLRMNEVEEIYIEMDANGNAIYSELITTPERFNCSAKVNGLKSNRYGSKQKRLDSVTDLVKIAKWANTDHKPLVKELLEFPHGDSDDLVDALSWAMIAIRDNYENNLGNIDQAFVENFGAVEIEEQSVW